MPDLSRIAEALVEPIGFLWLIHLIAALRWTWGRKWRPAFFCWFVAGILTAVGSTSWPKQLLAGLERPYAGQAMEKMAAGDVVVMLGGVLAASTHDTFGLDFGSAVDRVITAVELLRRGKASTLILGGGSGQRKTPDDSKYLEGPLLGHWLKTWGLTTSNVVLLTACRNTRDEALQVRDLAKERHWQRILLVTSAYHMKRAEAIFRNLDIPVVPVACDFAGMGGLENATPFNPVPKSDRFQQLDLFVHEMIGWYYYRLRGWVTEKKGA